MSAELLDAVFGQIAYSLLGFVLGWLVGREARKIEEVHRVVVEEGEEMSESVAEVEKTPQSKFGVFLVVLAIFTVIQTAYFSYEQNRVTECLSNYNHSLAEVQNLRAQWLDQDRQAFIEFFDTYQGNPTEEERRAAFFNLIETYEKNTERRKSTPLPRLEKCD